MKAFGIQAKAIHGFKNYSKELFMADHDGRYHCGYRCLAACHCVRYCIRRIARKGIITAIIAGFIISLLGEVKFRSAALPVRSSSLSTALSSNTERPG